MAKPSSEMKACGKTHRGTQCIIISVPKDFSEELSIYTGDFCWEVVEWYDMYAQVHVCKCGNSHPMVFVWTLEDSRLPESWPTSFLFHVGGLGW